MTHFRSPRKSYTALSLFYFFDFASLGFFLPYFPLYLQKLQMNKWEIGLLLSLLMIARVGIPVFWGRLSDQTGKGYEILLTNAWLSSILLFFLYFKKSFWGIFVVLSFSMFFRTSLLPLTEAISMKLITFTKSSYGFIRVWGSLGFLSASLLGGALISYWGVRIVPTLLICTFFVSAIAITFLEKEEPEHASPSISSWKNLLQYNFIIILTSGLLMQSSHSAYYEYFSIYMKQMGTSAWMIGILWAMAMASEILMMLSWRKWDDLFSPYSILCVSYVASILRWMGLAYFTSFWSIGTLQLFHGLSFGTFHLANIYWIKRNIPSADQSTAQALYGSLVFGFGGVVGFLGAGRLTEFLNLSSIYIWSAAVAFLGFLIFSLGFKKHYFIDEEKLPI